MFSRTSWCLEIVLTPIRYFHMQQLQQNKSLSLLYVLNATFSMWSMCPLLVAMVLKGLTDDYNPFSAHVTQTREKLPFTEFKTQLRLFECTLRYQNKTQSDEVMTTKYKVSRPKHNAKEERYFNRELLICEKVGQKARDCRNKDKKIHGKNTKENKTACGRNKVATILESCEIKLNFIHLFV